MHIESNDGSLVRWHHRPALLRDALHRFGGGRQLSLKSLELGRGSKARRHLLVEGNEIGDRSRYCRSMVLGARTSRALWYGVDYRKVLFTMKPAASSALATAPFLTDLAKESSTWSGACGAGACEAGGG